jgi:tetratricopeptide (TPR) repeat protein
MLIDLRRLKKDSSRVARAAAAITLSEGAVQSRGQPSDGRVRQLGPFKNRTMVVGAIIVSILALAGASYFLFFRPALRPVSNRVAVAVFENRTGDTSLDGLGALITESIAQGIAGVGAVDVVPSDEGIRVWQRLTTGSQRTDLLSAFGGETKARLIVTGAYYRQADSLFIHARVMDSETGKNLKVMKPIGTMIEKRMFAIESVRQRLMGAIAFEFDMWGSYYNDPSYFPTIAAYQEFKAGWELFLRGEYLTSSDHFCRSIEIDQAFTLPLGIQAYAYANAGRYSKADSVAQYLERLRPTLVKGDLLLLDHMQAMLRGDNLTLLSVMREIARRAPTVPVLRFQWGADALRLNCPREAITALSGLDRADSTSFHGWVYTWGRITLAHHLLNEHEKELREAEIGRQQLPSRISTIWYEVRALAALGRFDEIWKRFDEACAFPEKGEGTPGGIMTSCARELRYHGFGNAARQTIQRAIDWYVSRPDSEQQSSSRQSALAHAYYVAERFVDARGIYETLLRQDPDNIAYQGFLGAIAARVKDTTEARRIDGILKKTNRPYIFGEHTYWRACIASLLGDKDQAVSLLRKALSEGLTYPELHADVDLEPLKDYPPFQELMKPKE